MAESLTLNLGTSLVATLSNPVSDGVATFTMDLSNFLAAAFSSGNGANQANQLYDEVTTLVASGTLTLSVYNFGAAADQLGQSRAVTKLRLLALQVLGNLNCYKVTGATVNAAGTGYLVGDTLVAAGGTGTAAKFTVTTTGTSGIITGVALLAYQGYTGGSYTVLPSVTGNAVTGGSGTSATLNFTTGQYLAATPPTFTDTDILTFGGDGATSALTSLLGTNADKLFLPSGTSNAPGTLLLCGGGAAAWTVGASTTNKNIKIVNTGANPVTFRLVVAGGT